ncbi:hypothetical protein Acsp05_23670 [Actinokineospora sp. NBRC 105648]|nr:hypothetical protein Acsp05_23670 [Actinokineospora sp. NBRC 105648]
MVETIQAHQPDVVIAHSLGSVVAYEALWNSGATVDLLITLGSPLALPNVGTHVRLRPDRRRPRRGARTL